MYFICFPFIKYRSGIQMIRTFTIIIIKIKVTVSKCWFNIIIFFFTIVGMILKRTSTEVIWNVRPSNAPQRCVRWSLWMPGAGIPTSEMFTGRARHAPGVALHSRVSGAWRGIQTPYTFMWVIGAENAASLSLIRAAWSVTATQCASRMPEVCSA